MSFRLPAPTARRSTWLTLCLLLLLRLTSGQSIQSATLLGPAPSNNVTISATALDDAGRVYLAGVFTGTLTLGSTTFTAPGPTPNLFVARLDSTGAYQWAAQADAGQGVEVTAIAPGPGGSAYLTGRTSGGTTFGSYTPPVPPNGASYVACISATGQWQWATATNTTATSGTLAQNAQDLTVDAAGNAYVTGLFTSSNIIFGSISVAKPNQAGANVFVAKLNAAGQWQWGAAGGGEWTDFPRRVRADAAGNVYVAGYFSSPLSTYGSSQISSVGGSYEVFVAKLNAAGQWQWARSAGNPTGLDDLRGLAVSNTGQVAITGRFYPPTATFGPFTLGTPTATRGDEVYVAQLDAATGQWQWAVAAGSEAGDESYNAAYDPAGNLYVTGYYGPTRLTAGPLSQPNVGGNDLFVLRLSPSGSFLGALGAGGSANDYGLNLRVTPTGRPYLLGTIDGTVRLGSTTLTATPGPRLFLSRLGSTVLATRPVRAAQPALTLWPNPAASGTVQLLGAQPQQPIQLLDARGRTVCSRPLGAASPTVPVSFPLPANLPAGTYFVRQGSRTQLLLVQ